MANLMDMIMGQLGGDTLKQLSGQLGTDEKTAGTATGAAVATLLGALSRNASNEAGAQALSKALERDHDGGVLKDVQGLLANPQLEQGDGIVRHVLGDRRSAVGNGLAKSTGLGSGSMDKLLTAVAPIVMGALGREQRSQGMNASALAGFLGQERQTMEQQQPQAMGMLSRMLDTDGDGDLDFGDLVKHGSGLLGKFLGGK